MPEENRLKNDSKGKADEQNGKPEILLALIEHGSRPIATLIIGLALVIWLFFVRGQLFDFLNNAEALKIGSFEVKLRDIAKNVNLDPTLRALKELNGQQLQLFLIIGKKREQIRYEGEEVTDGNLSILKDAGLLSSYEKLPNGDYKWAVSENGVKLHNIITGLIFTSVQQSAKGETEKK
ncbi:MAG: hypothetical protein JNJ50_00045 [Acidobacteria bacterium]|nr:hypothetical protein [Acidobacteriota bacterium]